eukprot:scaffold28547_cov35-Tisochrysis_lutea.AAC.1
MASLSAVPSLVAAQAPREGPGAANEASRRGGQQWYSERLDGRETNARGSRQGVLTHETRTCGLVEVG